MNKQHALCEKFQAILSSKKIGDERYKNIIKEFFNVDSSEFFLEDILANATDKQLLNLDARWHDTNV